MPHLTVRVSDVDLRELRAAAALDGVAVSELVRVAVRREARSVLAAAPKGWDPAEDAGGPWYCTGCDARTAAADRYCRACGAGPWDPPTC